MTTALPEATPAHRAALLLHAFSAADRQWVLQGLGGAQQEALRGLLGELEELGIPREANIAEALTDTSANDGDRCAHALQALELARVRCLARELAAEPPMLVAALLGSHSWSWRGALLRELPAPFARDVERLASRAGAAGELQAAVLAAVAELVPSLHDGTTPAARASLWQLARRSLSALRSRA